MKLPRAFGAITNRNRGNHPMNDLNPLSCYIALESDISPSKVTELIDRAFCGLSIELAVVNFKSLRLVPRLNVTDISIY